MPILGGASSKFIFLGPQGEFVDILHSLPNIWKSFTFYEKCNQNYCGFLTYFILLKMKIGITLMIKIC